jgi:hypothetical protein
MDFIGYHSKNSTKPGKNIRISLDITAKIAPTLEKNIRISLDITAKIAPTLEII